MTATYRRNGARTWLNFLLFFDLLVAVACGLLLRAAPDLTRALVQATTLNQALNLVILGAFAVGFVLITAWVVRAAREERAVNRFWSRELEAAALGRRPSLEGIERSTLGERIGLISELNRAGVQWESGVLADSIADREEPRVALARFTAGALVLLGLLGTFVGLLITIGGVTEVVDGLQATPGDDIEAFLIPLKVGLRTPLSGMAVAFSTSLIGLAGSLVLGAGALALAAAQASWMSKLEEVTVLFLSPRGRGLASSSVSASVSASGATAGPASVVGSIPDAGLARLEASARLLLESQGAAGEHVARLDAAGQRLAGGVADLRAQFADLTAHIERAESLLMRVADGQTVGRNVVNDLGVKLADLASAAVAVRAEVRDGVAELAAAQRGSAKALGDGLAASLAGLERSQGQSPDLVGLGAALDGLAAELRRVRGAGGNALGGAPGGERRQGTTSDGPTAGGRSSGGQ